MAENPYSIEQDLTELKAMVEMLVPYIYEDELYGKLRITTARLTPGAMLLRFRRLNALRDRLSQAEADLLLKLHDQHAKVRAEWGVAYAKKMLREAEARLRDIQTYLDECREDPRACANAYLPEALRRTIVAERLAELPPSDFEGSGLKPKLGKVDGGLRGNIQEAPFLWDEVLRPVYPQDSFWWLYGRPQPPE
ncbi:MAG: hypothetical protein JNM70_19990 [Anaerolineae bacterium]|nr:hypothetical protein [Anaerolineae bacterium]